MNKMLKSYLQLRTLLVMHVRVLLQESEDLSHQLILKISIIIQVRKLERLYSVSRLERLDQS